MKGKDHAGDVGQRLEQSPVALTQEPRQCLIVNICLPVAQQRIRQRIQFVHPDVRAQALRASRLHQGNQIVSPPWLTKNLLDLRDQAV